MAAIGKGDFVECIDARPFDWDRDLQVLTLRAVYQVRGVVTNAIAPDGTERPSLFLEEVRLPVDPDWQSEPAFDAARFRPIYRPREDAFDHLKAPPVRVSEDA